MVRSMRQTPRHTDCKPRSSDRIRLSRLCSAPLGFFPLRKTALFPREHVSYAVRSSTVPGDANDATPTPPTTPATTQMATYPPVQPGDELTAFLLHIPKFLRNPGGYMLALGHFIVNSLRLSRQFWVPSPSATLSRSLAVLIVVALFCILTNGIDAACRVLLQFYRQSPPM